MAVVMRAMKEARALMVGARTAMVVARAAVPILLSVLHFHQSAQSGGTVSAVVTDRAVKGVALESMV